MRVKYVGPSPEVEIGPSGQYVKRGETVDVDDEVAESLCQQDAWEKAPQAKKKEGS